MESKPYPRRPIHRRDIQFTIEMSKPLSRHSSHREKAETLKCPNDRCDELDKCNKETEKHSETGLSNGTSDNLTPLLSDYPTHYNRINSYRFWLQLKKPSEIG